MRKKKKEKERREAFRHTNPFSVLFFHPTLFNYFFFLHDRVLPSDLSSSYWFQQIWLFERKMLDEKETCFVQQITLGWKTQGPILPYTESPQLRNHLRRLYITWSSWRCPGSLHCRWTRWPLKVSFNSIYSMIVFYSMITVRWYEGEDYVLFCYLSFGDQYFSL